MRLLLATAVGLIVLHPTSLPSFGRGEARIGRCVIPTGRSSPAFGRGEARMARPVDRARGSFALHPRSLPSFGRGYPRMPASLARTHHSVALAPRSFAPFGTREVAGFRCIVFAYSSLPSFGRGEARMRLSIDGSNGSVAPHPASSLSFGGGEARGQTAHKRNKSRVSPFWCRCFRPSGKSLGTGTTCASCSVCSTRTDHG